MKSSGPEYVEVDVSDVSKASLSSIHCCKLGPLGLTHFCLAVASSISSSSSLSSTGEVEPNVKLSGVCPLASISCGAKFACARRRRNVSRQTDWLTCSVACEEGESGGDVNCGGDSREIAC